MPTLKKYPAFDINRNLSLGVPEVLLSGTDTRVALIGASDRNKYHCSNKPIDDVMPFGSCTSSTVFGRSFEVAVNTHAQFSAIENNDALFRAVDDFMEDTRHELLSLLTRHSPVDAEILFAASGTDAELLALWLAGGEASDQIVNIIVGPTEVGSGTVYAAGALNFDNLAACGASVVKGSAASADLAARSSVRTVPVRRNDGTVRSQEDIDREIEAIVARDVANGSNVLLHIIAHSKTGVHAPSLQCAEALRRSFPEKVFVVVDAAQGRFSRRGLVTVLALDFMVIVTGSKFFGGPPFSGGLIVPKALNPAKRGINEVPSGFDLYFAQTDFPRAWSGIRENLPQTASVGSAIRWSAAMHEIRRYYQTPSSLRLEILRAFESLVPAVFAASDFIVLIPPGEPVLDDESERLLQSKTTVFSFKVRIERNSKLCRSKEELSTIFRWLNYDVSSLLSDAEPETRRALAPKHHIGQPVALSEETGIAVLRVAIGAVLITQVACDKNVGTNLGQRICWLEDQLISLKRKIEVIAARFDEILQAEAG